MEKVENWVKQDADYIFHELTRSICPECKTVIDAQIIIQPTFPIWLNIPLSKSSAFFKPLSIRETLAVGMAIIAP